MAMREPGAQIALPVSLDVEARFETFHPGNNAAVIAALQAPATPGIWLAGPPGSGRSHLLQAVVAAAPAGAALYLPLASGLPAAAVDGLGGALTVCLDDVDVVAGDRDWETRLFALYEQLVRDGGCLIASAGARPAGAPFTLHDLVSRFAALAPYRLQPPDDDTRLAALLLRAENRGLMLDAAAAQYLLRRLPRDLPRLFRWLQRLDAHALVHQRRLTLPFVRGALDELGVGSE
ncbi:MAG: DnaA regulatory inactivator Hda [Pseudomonadota bacterium]